MQATKMQEENPISQSQQTRPLRDKKVGDLTKDKKRLVEVPYTASLADTMNALMANHVGAVPVAAPPGHWIGAGGSMIVETDKTTGAARKHYIGMVTMLDVLAHIARSSRVEEDLDVERLMQVEVSSVIGHCLESLTLWTLNCNTSIVDCMEVFSKGIHRALVPIESHTENIPGVELVESASGYRMLTQVDVVKFLKAHEGELRGIMTRQVSELGALADVVFAVTNKTRVIDAIKSMNAAGLTAVPIVESNEDLDADRLINGKGGKLVGTFSATDLRGCSMSQLGSCLRLNVVEFIDKCSTTSLHEASGLKTSTDELITCSPDSPLVEVVNKAINSHVHRVWVVDGSGLLTGLISLTDIIRVVRAWMLSLV